MSAEKLIGEIETLVRQDKYDEIPEEARNFSLADWQDAAKHTIPCDDFSITENENSFTVHIDKLKGKVQCFPNVFVGDIFASELLNHHSVTTDDTVPKSTLKHS